MMLCQGDSSTLATRNSKVKNYLHIIHKFICLLSDGGEGRYSIQNTLIVAKVERSGPIKLKT